MNRLLYAILLWSYGCGAGVPVQLRLDQFRFDLSVDDAVEETEAELVESGLLPRESGGLPERWPDDLPDLCYDFVARTDEGRGTRIDLTPDPAEDPSGAQVFQAINDGRVERIEIDRISVRIEVNTLNIPLPPLELQAADDPAAGPDDRSAWFMIGTVGGPALSRGCGDTATAPLVDAGELKDVDLEFARGGESFLNQQLADEACVTAAETGGDPLACKELGVRARARLVLDTAQNPERPRGRVRIRPVVIATFFVQPF